MKKLKKVLKKYKKGKITESDVIARFAIYFWTQLPKHYGLMGFAPEEWDEEAEQTYNPYTDPVPDSWEDIKVVVNPSFTFGKKEENKA